MWESLDMGKCGKFPPKWRCILFIAEKTIELNGELSSKPCDWLPEGKETIGEQLENERMID